MALVLSAGILLGRAASSWFFGAAGCALALAACFLLRGRGRFCALLTLALALGCLRGFFAYHPVLPPAGSYQVTGIVSSEVELRNERQIRTSLTRVTLDGVPLSGGAYWSFYQAEIPAGLLPGQQVSFQAELYHPSGPSNPDGYDFREELLRRGIRVGLYGDGDLRISDPEGFSLAGRVAALRHRLTLALLFSPLGEETGGYAAAMLLGNRTFVPREDRTAFSRLGIAHLLSVSGFHVGVLVGALALVFRLLRLPQRVRLGGYALLLGAYILLCGSAQPVIRASLLLLLFRGGRMLRRPRSLLHLLSAVLILMLLWSPVQLTGLSFQLSFCAVLGLALITPFLASLRKPASAPLRRLWQSLAAGLGAQTGILLPELYAFQELPLLGLLINVPLLFLSGVLIGLYWAALLTLPVPWLSGPVCAAARGLTGLILSGVRLLGGIPGITLWTKAPNLLSAAGILLIAGGLCALFRWKPRVRAILSGAGAAILALSLIPLPHGATEYFQFSVGDADAALLWDQDVALVIDAGYEDGVLSDFLHRRRLTPSAVILTHLHSDHVYGLQSLREDHIPIPEVYLPEDAAEADIHPNVIALLKELQDDGTVFHSLAKTDRILLPSGEIRVLWPEQGMTRPGQDANESCLVLRFDLKGTSLLHTGDLAGRYEMYSAVPADLLKVAHHGSAHSSSAAFLSAVAPRTALLSCGSPERHLSFRERLDPNVPLYSTAVQGMLTVTFNDGSYTVHSVLPRTESSPAAGLPPGPPEEEETPDP